jgi:hypothetical protein
MKRLALLTLVLAINGCAGRYYWHSSSRYDYAAYPTAPAQVVVTQPPPPVPVVQELQPPPPSSNAVWVAGHWTYNGMWVWVDGTWVNGYSGWVWTPPVVVLVDGYYVLHRGYFRQPTYQPAPVYSQPNRIYISAGGHVGGGHQYYQQPPQQYQPPPQQYQPPPQHGHPQPLVQPRELSVPGGVVRTPPQPQQEPQHPVLVAPGATVSREPSHAPQHPAEAQGRPPVLSNVQPVQERPVPQVNPHVGGPQPMPVPQQPPAPQQQPSAGRPMPMPQQQPSAGRPMPMPQQQPPMARPPVATPVPQQRAPMPAPQQPPPQVTPGGYGGISARHGHQSAPAPMPMPQQRAPQSVAPHHPSAAPGRPAAPSAAHGKPMGRGRKEPEAKIGRAHV